MTAELVTQPLSDQERQSLADYEVKIERGIHAFIEVGTALVVIRDAKLYRETHKTFDAYCQERWGLGRNYANKLIGAAGVVANLTAAPTVSALPTKESQVRPLASLPPDKQVEAWTEAEAIAPNGKPTGPIVAEIVRDRFPRSAPSRESEDSYGDVPPKLSPEPGEDADDPEDVSTFLAQRAKEPNTNQWRSDVMDVQRITDKHTPHEIATIFRNHVPQKTQRQYEQRQMRKLATWLAEYAEGIQPEGRPQGGGTGEKPHIAVYERLVLLTDDLLNVSPEEIKRQRNTPGNRRLWSGDKQQLKKLQRWLDDLLAEDARTE